MSSTPESQRQSQKNPRDSMDTLPTGADAEATSARGGGERDLGGEGNVSADRRYREGVKETLASGEVEELAEEAARALDGEEGEELRDAQERGRRGQHR
jgi:hypothetical protein